MLRRFLLPLACGAVLFFACGKPSSNDFSDTTITAAPPSDADVGFASNGWSPQTGAGRELFAVKLDGTGLTRLTSCNNAGPCDIFDPAFSPERTRAVALRRTSTDVPPALLYLDLTRSVSAELVSSDGRASGVDWSVNADFLVYSAAGQGGVDDIYRTDVARPTSDNLQNTLDVTCPPASIVQTFTCDPTIAERRPRLDPTNTTAIYERVPAGGKGGIYLYVAADNQVLVAPPGPGSDPLPGSSYFVGSNADPAFSPDAQSVVFRRLTAVADGSFGTWDILTVRLDGTGLKLLVSGPVFRGPPDWGPQGIVFPEIDLATGQSSLVAVQPDGSGRRAFFTLDPGYLLSSPRWLK
jgi:Tol biopolymer transport system component